MTRRLYRIRIPESGIEDTDGSAQSNLSKQGLVEGGSAVKAVSTGPNDVTLDVQFRGKYAERKGVELAELLNANPFQTLPYVRVEDPHDEDGYYAVESSTDARIQPQTDAVVSVSASLSRIGTRTSQFRQLGAKESDVTNDFGAGGTPNLAIPDRAQYVRWLDPTSKQSSPASPTATVAGEFATSAHYDIADAPYSGQVALCYDLPYGEEGDIDIRVWDTFGDTKEETLSEGGEATAGGATVGGATLSAPDQTLANRWQRVFATDHEFVGAAVIENGHLRLEVDEVEGRLRAYRWDGDTYQLTQLGASSWHLFDLDVRHLSMARIEAEVAFRDQATKDIETLTMSLQRGQTDVLWTRPEGGTATPIGLVDRLDPIAAEWTVDPSPTKGLIPRTEVE